MRFGPYLVLAAAAAALAACGARKAPAKAETSPIPPPAGYAYDVLADVQNARFALARRQTVPAENDLVRAVAAAKRLRDDTASLFLADAPAAGSAEARTRFTDAQALTLLTDAEADVSFGQGRDADRLLADLEAHVPSKIVPATLPLVRARESLDLAQEAQSSGRYGALGLQLQSASQALQTYAGQPHAAEVKQLASTLSGWLGDPDALGRLPLGQPARWRDQVQGWLPSSLAPPPAPAL